MRRVAARAAAGLSLPPERPRDQDGAEPGAEVLRREVGAPDLPEIGVDVRRVDRLARPALVQVLEEPVAGQVLAPADHRGEPPVVDVDRVMLAALLGELEAHGGAVDRRVRGPEWTARGTRR